MDIVNDMERAARKFNEKEKDDPFARVDENNPSTDDMQRGSVLLDKFDLTRVDLLYEQQINRAKELVYLYFIL